MARLEVLGGGPSSIPDRVILAGIAVALVACPVVFWPHLYDDFTLLKQGTLLVGAAVVLVGLALGRFELPASLWLWTAVGAWVLILLLSHVAGEDPAGGTLGVYQYRQGLVTQLAYVVLFAGAARLAAVGMGRTVLLLPLAGLAGVFAYTLVQGIGQDPVNWWTDTAERAIGTIGNANELAGYGAVSLIGIAALPATRRGRVVIAAAVAAVVFIVVEAESRSGVMALAVFVFAVPLAWWLGKQPWRELRLTVTALAAGLVAGITLSLVAGLIAGLGSLDGTASRIAQPDRGGATRLSLWEGTLRAVGSDPLTGAGPDGLWLTFPRHRPAQLEGSFEEYDLVAQSAHNIILDTAANTGVFGLAALGLLAGLATIPPIQRRRAYPDSGSLSWELAWAGLAAYAVMLLLNPISMAAQALCFVVLGVMAGHGRRLAAPLRFAVPLQLAPAAALAGGAVVLAVLLPVADLRSQAGYEAFASGDYSGAAEDYRSASNLLPFDRWYATRRAEALLSASVGGSTSDASAARNAYAALDDRFGLSSDDALYAAAAMLGAGAAPGDIHAMIDRAVALNPNGIEIQVRATALRDAVDLGGELTLAPNGRVVVRANSSTTTAR